MDPFELTDDAILDIDAAWLYLLDKEGVETADRIVTELFKGFYELADIPAKGHRRADLTSKEVLFYTVYSYLVVYKRGIPLRILAVLHGKRNGMANSGATSMKLRQ